jgi:hypothetical protein
MATRERASPTEAGPVRRAGSAQPTVPPPDGPPKADRPSVTPPPAPLARVALSTLHVGVRVRRRKQVHRGTVAARLLVVLAWVGLVSLAGTVSGGRGWVVAIVTGAAFLAAVLMFRKVGRLRSRDRVAARLTLGLVGFVSVSTALLVFAVASPGPLSAGAEFHRGFYTGVGGRIYDVAAMHPGVMLLAIVLLWLWLQASSWLRSRRLPSWLRGAVTLITALFAVLLMVSLIDEIALTGLEPWIAALVVTVVPSVMLATRTGWQAIRPGLDPLGTWETEGPLQRRRLFTGRQPVRVLLLLLLSLVLGVVGWLILNAPVPDEWLIEAADPEAVEFTFVFARAGLGLGLIALATLAYLSARRRAAQRATGVLAEDARAAVLYLRSFQDDQVRVHAHNSPRRALIIRMLGRRKERFEEVIVWHLWRFGPVVGVGRPADRLPPLGAAREYLSDDEWREHVETMMQRSSLIVVALGRTDGLRWEIETVHRLGFDRKAVLVMPPVTREERAERWSSLRTLAAQIGWAPLPPQPEDNALVYRLTTEGGWLQLVGGHVDEWNYEVALEVAASGDV